MNRKLLLSFAAAALIGQAAPASAREIPAAGLTVREVADWLQAAGLKAEVQKVDNDVANSEIVKSAADGVNFDIYFFQCDAGRCRSIQYAAGWSDMPGITADKLIEWDRAKRYIRAYRSAGDNVWGEYDVDVAPGGTYEMLDHSLQRWRSSIGQFKAFIGQ